MSSLFVLKRNRIVRNNKGASAGEEHDVEHEETTTSTTMYPVREMSWFSRQRMSE
jgi:hypothetical protein